MEPDARRRVHQLLERTALSPADASLDLMPLERHYAGADWDGRHRSQRGAAPRRPLQVDLHAARARLAERTYRSLGNFLLTLKQLRPTRQCPSSTSSRCSARSSRGRWSRTRRVDSCGGGGGEARAVDPEAALLLQASVHFQADQLAEQPQLGGALAGDAELHERRRARPRCRQSRAPRRPPAAAQYSTTISNVSSQKN